VGHRRKEGSGVSLSLPPKHPGIRYSHCRAFFSCAVIPYFLLLKQDAQNWA
jgi:hypothetical protein